MVTYKNIKSNYSLRFHKPMRLIFSFITLWAFFFNSIGIGLLNEAWAATTPSALLSAGPNRVGGPSASFNGEDIRNFVLPYSLGKVNDKWEGSSGKVVVHIQDAHCNYSAQHSISDMIGFLSDTYNIDLVMLEGGKGNYDLSVFTKIKDPEIRKRVSDYFVKEGRISGPEFFAINNPYETTLFGIENEDLYSANLDVYRKSLGIKEDVDKHLNMLTHAINNFKHKMYTKPLKEMDILVRQYDSKELDFKEYVVTLSDKAKANKVDMFKFKNITSLLELLRNEDSIDFEKANSERRMLIEKLNNKLSKRELENLVKIALQFRKGDISNEDFYGYLIHKAQFAGVALDNLPNLLEYSEYTKKYEAIDKTILFKEIKKLEETIMLTLLNTEDQKTLYTLDKNLSIIKDMFNIALVKDEYDYYEDNKKSFNTINYLKFINAKGPQLGFSFTIDESISKLDEYRANMEKFYAYSLKRDNAFVKNIESKLKKENKAVTVLVTGGFHTGNLKSLFKNKGYTYIEIMPSIKTVDAENPYFELLSGGKCHIESIVDASISGIAIRHVLSEMGIPERRVFELSVDVATQLLQEGRVTLLMPYGYTTLVFGDNELAKLDNETWATRAKVATAETPVGQRLDKKVGTIGDQSVYAVRVRYEKRIGMGSPSALVGQEGRSVDLAKAIRVLLPGQALEGTTVSHGGRVTIEGHEPGDTYITLSHDPGYQDLEAHDLAELLQLHSELKEKLIAELTNLGITTTSAQKIVNLFTQENARDIIWFITGNNGTSLPWMFHHRALRKNRMHFTLYGRDGNADPVNIARALIHELGVFAEQTDEQNRQLVLNPGRNIDDVLARAEAKIAGQAASEASYDAQMAEEPIESDPAAAFRNAGLEDMLLDGDRFRFESIQPIDYKNMQRAIQALSMLGIDITPQNIFDILFMINTESNLQKYAPVVGFEAIRGIVISKLKERNQGLLQEAWLTGYGFVTAFRTWVILGGDVGAMIDLSRQTSDEELEALAKGEAGKDAFMAEEPLSDGALAYRLGLAKDDDWYSDADFKEAKRIQQSGGDVQSFIDSVQAKMERAVQQLDEFARQRTERVKQLRERILSGEVLNDGALAYQLGLAKDDDWYSDTEFVEFRELMRTTSPDAFMAEE
ncbi:MAG: hypothetical protein KKE01_07695, partial [Candidatus Omnitrophica bacterium]|nr:hypothetical protein [Candidatus Omnitrophota bacterium]